MIEYNSFTKSLSFLSSPLAFYSSLHSTFMLIDKLYQIKKEMYAAFSVILCKKFLPFFTVFI